MNFCTQSLGTTITTDQAEEDGYPVENLIVHSNQLSNTLLSPNNCNHFSSTNNQTGFMTVRFAKTPVKVKLTFSVPIDISHIVICPNVSKQSSSGFQIQATITGKAKSPDEKYSLSNHIVAKEFINTSSSPVPKLLVFKNPRFQLKPQYHSIPLRHFELYKNFPKAFGMRHPSFFACEKVLSLELTILKVSGASIPCLGLLQVWGQPSIHSTKLEIDKLLSAWLKIVKPKNQVILPSGSDNCNSTKRKRSAESPESNATSEFAAGNETKKRKLGSAEEAPIPEIPDDFYDPITCEIMCQPLRLPSGVAVDASTLEKYDLEERSWGRSPNDPFTGLEFSDISRPVPDAGLKSRIELFLSQHSFDKRFQNLPRTVGSSGKSRKGPVGLGDFEKLNIEPNHSVSISPESVNLKIPIPSSASNSSESLLNQELANTFGGNNGCDNFLFVKSNNSQSGTSHPNEKKFNCLKCEIKVVTNAENPTLSTTVKPSYTSTCGHVIICRPCLLSWNKQVENTCQICQLKWMVKDLSKLLI